MVNHAQSVPFVQGLVKGWRLVGPTLGMVGLARFEHRGEGSTGIKSVMPHWRVQEAKDTCKLRASFSAQSSAL
jgi:hypothetical protein